MTDLPTAEQQLGRHDLADDIGALGERGLAGEPVERGAPEPRLDEVLHRGESLLGVSFVFAGDFHDETNVSDVARQRGLGHALTIPHIVR
jgi:hypothetical protein